MFGSVTSNDFDNTQIAHFSILLAAFAVGLIGLSRTELFVRFKMFMVWLAIILLLVLAYSYWEDLRNSKFFASLVPGTPVISETGAMEFIKADDGHFYIKAEVNGADIKFMVDTGATDIVLNLEDAKKAGIDTNSLNFNKVYSTANGISYGAAVKIGYLRVGNYEMQDFYAGINKGELDSSLLGMAFLSKFRSYSVEGNRLILKP